MAVTETLLNEFSLSIECHSESLENSTTASRRATSEAMPVLTRFWYVVLVADPDIYMSCFTGNFQASREVTDSSPPYFHSNTTSVRNVQSSLISCSCIGVALRFLIT